MSEPTPGSESSTSGDVGDEAPVRRRADRHKDHKHPWLRRGGIAVGVTLGMLLLVVGGWVAVVAPVEPPQLTP